MKKINSRYAVSTLRVVTALSGITATLTAMLFFNSIYAVMAIAMIGGGLTVLIDEKIKK
jgi:hypothetical protein